MSKHGVRPGTLRISGTGLPGGTVVELDGKNIGRGLTGLTLRIGADERPTGVLNVLLHQADVEVEDALVVVPDATKDLLIRLGWTPPIEEAP